jgi:hypothetical protein
MPDPQLVLRFENRAALREEYEQNLAHGRAFVAHAGGLSLFSPCTLILEAADLDAQLVLACEVVMVGETHGGLALQFLDRSEASLTRLRDFVMGYEDEDEDEDEDEPPDSEAPGAGAAGQRVIVEARAAKLRNLNPAQRMQVARSNVLEERVLLERLYGSAVWELLLRNPKITLPEVARMARKGTMPRPLLDLIADNEQWIRQSLVRRALLANPRLSTDGVQRVLRTLPPRELKLVPQQTAYPQSVRQAATRLMRGG